MQQESIERVQRSHQQVVAQPVALAASFYAQLFELEPKLRPLFPADLTSLQAHFDAALSMVVNNLSDAEKLDRLLRDLGAQHLAFGAQPHHYFVVRQALVAALRDHSGDSWSQELEADWLRAISLVSSFMLQGAAMETAVVSERFSRDGE